jgi:uncharacterized membrane protein
MEVVVVNWDDDDRYWKLGQFYVNRNDRRIFVSNRFGFGRTLNFAHPVSWLMFAAPIAVGVIVAANKG